MPTTSRERGVLAFVGGEAGAEDGVFEELLTSSGDALILPTAAAFERPERVVAAWKALFLALGVEIRPLMVLTRADAERAENAAIVRDAGLICLPGGSPLHLRSVLKGSAVFAALEQAWEGGATVIGSDEASTVLGDPMVDPRGGAFTVGLGLVDHLAVVTRHAGAESHLLTRTLELAPADMPVAVVTGASALVRGRGGRWHATGTGEVLVYRDRQITELAAIESGSALDPIS